VFCGGGREIGQRTEGSSRKGSMQEKDDHQELVDCIVGKLGRNVNEPDERSLALRIFSRSGSGISL